MAEGSVTQSRHLQMRWNRDSWRRLAQDFYLACKCDSENNGRCSHCEQYEHLTLKGIGND